MRKSNPDIPISILSLILFQSSGGGNVFRGCYVHARVLAGQGEHVLHAARTAANILIVCGVAGGLTAVLFWLRRHVILASVLMLSGIAPLMFDTKAFVFVGLPMASGGFLVFCAK